MLNSSSILPVKLISFSGNLKDNKILLSWKVDLNETADKFEVEKSINSGKFYSVGTVAGTSLPGTSSYSFSDPVSANEKLAYRLRMTDKNQKIEYSKIISFNTTGNAGNYIRLIQNPVFDKLNIGFQTSGRETLSIRIIDMTGSVRTSQLINAQPGNNVLYVALPSTLTTGTYVVSVTHSKGTFNQKFLKQ